MKRHILMIALLCSMSVGAQDRVVTSMNFGWKFHAGAVDGATSTAFDDSGWRDVDLPHDFQIEQPWIPPTADERPDNSDQGANIKSRLSSRGFKEMGIGWYRRTLIPEASWRGKRILLDFEGIMYVGDVYLNGELVGKTDYGYLGFEVDITKKLHWDRPNVIAVMADTREPNNSRWYTGGGLFRDVNLVVTDPEIYFTRHSLYITTHANREVNIQFESANYTKSNPATESVGVRILDPQGQVVADQREDIRRNNKLRIQELRLSPITIANAQLWDCEHPNLYTAELTLYDGNGNARDQVRQHFGIRTVEFSPAYGMRLNGKKVLLKGIANHHTLGALGAAAYPRAIEKRIQMLKEFGFNHIRTSHNPYSTSLLDLCDRYGILVVDELYDKWLDLYCGGREKWMNLWQHDVPEFVKRDRSHPCVVFWSLGNELQTYTNLPFGDWGVTPYKLLKELLLRYDSTRLVTVAMHPRGRSHETDSLPAPLAMVTDIQAYNYRYMYFPGDSRRFPQMIFYQSEANTTMMGPNFYEMNLDKVIGLAYWGMIDYLGESRGWPAKGWSDGVFDISLEPKPRAWLLRSMFKPEEPTVHIGIIDNKASNELWNGIVFSNDGMSDHWNRHPGDTLSLFTYTNADEVELFVNGKSQGVKRNAKSDPKNRDRIKWDGIVYADGYIEAIARNDGNKSAVARHRIETSGKAVKLVVTPDNSNWHADGTDLQHLRVYAVDSKGRRVYTAQDELQFSVSGDARIVAVTNGDINSEELNVQDHRRLWNGSAMVILRAGKTPSSITVTTSTPGMKAVKTKLKTL